MDRRRFDALIKLLATPGSRRAGIGALLAVGSLGGIPGTLLASDTGKRKGRGKGRRKRRRKGHDGGQHPEPPAAECFVAARQCAAPEPGSPRAECDFAERSFTGEDHNGSIFRRIEGSGASFDDTDNRGSVFAEARLRFATFRGARLAGSTWGGACLFAADFTGADLGDDADALDGAVLCATIMPDGTRNDRDCGQSQTHPCCLPPPGGGGGGGQECGSCPAADQCHVAGRCVCTTPPAPNGAPCSDGNPLCIGGVCCGAGRKAIHGGCFQIAGRSGAACRQATCDGLVRDCGPFVDDCAEFLCVKATFVECNDNADCPVGQACDQSTAPGHCYAAC